MCKTRKAYAESQKFYSIKRYATESILENSTCGITISNTISLPTEPELEIDQRMKYVIYSFYICQDI